MRNDLATTRLCDDPENFPSSHQLFISFTNTPNAFLGLQGKHYVLHFSVDDVTVVRLRRKFLPDR